MQKNKLKFDPELRNSNVEYLFSLKNLIHIFKTTFYLFKYIHLTFLFFLFKINFKKK